MNSAKMLLTILTLLTCSFASAVNYSETIPYYGENFYQDLKSGTTNDDLKTSIKFVLTSTHIKKDNALDEIVSQCNGTNCYRHLNLGYDQARTHLLGNFYLVEEGNGEYGVRDVYCNRVRTSDEFGNNGPAPGDIPGGTVVNTEHTWPQSKFSGKHNKGFQKADMHHLYPTDNEMNSVRSSLAFGEVVKDKKQLRCRESRYGKPSNGSQDVFEPPTNHQGNVARALFYFAVRYDMNIDTEQESTLRKWSKEDPIDQDEISRNQFIFERQGNRNPFIDFPGLEDSISNL